MNKEKSMEVEVLEKNEENIKLRIKGVTPGLMAMIRRSILAEIPTMAIEWVDFIKNDSAMPDEIIAHRLGLIPLTFDKKAYKLPEECECNKEEFCPQCQVKLYLRKKGPCMVYSGDLKTTDESVKPVYDKIPIVELLENEELEFEAIAQLGYGKEHAKWQAGIMNFRNLAKVNLKDKKLVDKLIETCPKKVFEKNDGKIIVHEEKCDLCKICEEKYPEAVEIKIEGNEFLVEIERASGIPVEKLFFEAIETIEKKIRELEKNI